MAQEQSHNTALEESYRLRGLDRANKSKMKVLEKFKAIHKDRYDYSQFVYTRRVDPSIVICKEHGSFEISAGNHLAGNGCNQRYLDSKSGWRLDTWIERANVAPSFDSFKVYIIECWNKDEHFFKIGKTFSTVQKRFVGKHKMPYEFKIIKTIENEDGRYIHKLEKELHKLSAANKYKPKLYFGGSLNECYSESLIIKTE